MIHSFFFFIRKWKKYVWSHHVTVYLRVPSIHPTNVIGWSYDLKHCDIVQCLFFANLLFGKKMLIGWYFFRPNPHQRFFHLEMLSCEGTFYLLVSLPWCQNLASPNEISPSTSCIQIVLFLLEKQNWATPFAGYTNHPKAVGTNDGL